MFDQSGTRGWIRYKTVVGRIKSRRRKGSRSWTRYKVVVGRIRYREQGLDQVEGRKMLNQVQESRGGPCTREPELHQVKGNTGRRIRHKGQRAGPRRRLKGLDRSSGRWAGQGTREQGAVGWTRYKGTGGWTIGRGEPELDRMQGSRGQDQVQLMGGCTR